jgi:GNAT superfamily N-acetyltransferase
MLAGLRQVLRPVVTIHRYHFFEKDLTQPTPDLTARVPLEVREANLDDFERYEEAFAAGGVDLREARRRHERGDLCLIALSGNEPVSFDWSTFRPFYAPELDVTVDLGPGDAFGVFTFTLPEWRGKGIYPAIMSHKHRHLLSRGCSRTISYIAANNIQSLKGVQRAAQERTRTVWAIHVAGVKRPFRLGAARGGAPRLVR